MQLLDEKIIIIDDLLAWSKERRKVNAASHITGLMFPFPTRF